MTNRAINVIACLWPTIFQYPFSNQTDRGDPQCVLNQGRHVNKANSGSTIDLILLQLLPLLAFLRILQLTELLMQIIFN